MTYETILTERRGNGGILWVTLNRPEKLNALSMTLFADGVAAGAHGPVCALRCHYGSGPRVLRRRRLQRWRP